MIPHHRPELCNIDTGSWDAGTCSSNVPFLTAEFALVESAPDSGWRNGAHRRSQWCRARRNPGCPRRGTTVIATAGNEDRRSHILEAERTTRSTRAR
jgi:hypothetical protein